MKGSEKPKKLQKKQAQKALKVGGGRSRPSGLLAAGPGMAAEHAMIRPPARSE